MKVNLHRLSLSNLYICARSIISKIQESQYNEATYSRATIPYMISHAAPVLQSVPTIPPSTLVSIIESSKLVCRLPSNLDLR